LKTLALQRRRRHRMDLEGGPTPVVDAEVGKAPGRGELDRGDRARGGSCRKAAGGAGARRDRLSERPGAPAPTRADPASRRARGPSLAVRGSSIDVHYPCVADRHSLLPGPRSPVHTGLRVRHGYGRMNRGPVGSNRTPGRPSGGAGDRAAARPRCWRGRRSLDRAVAYAGQRSAHARTSPAQVYSSSISFASSAHPDDLGRRHW